MPAARKYESRAAQQAAYRKRQALAQQALLCRKGLPHLPAIPTLPGNARWRAMIEQARELLIKAAEEMQQYHDERTQTWQESEKAQELLQRSEGLQDTVAHLDDVP